MTSLPSVPEMVSGLVGLLFATCVLCAIFAIFTILGKTKALVVPPEEKELTRSEQQARQFDRVFRATFIAPEVRTARRLMLGAFLAAIACAAILETLTFLFSGKTAG